jgi:hypothetical protein
VRGAHSLSPAHALGKVLVDSMGVVDAAIGDLRRSLNVTAGDLQAGPPSPPAHAAPLQPHSRRMGCGYEFVTARILICLACGAECDGGGRAAA